MTAFCQLESGTTTTSPSYVYVTQISSTVFDFYLQYTTIGSSHGQNHYTVNLSTGSWVHSGSSGTLPTTNYNRVSPTVMLTPGNVNSYVSISGSNLRVFPPYQDMGTVSGNIALGGNGGGMVRLTIAGNTTIDLGFGAPSTSGVTMMMIELINGGAYTLTWTSGMTSSAVKWPGGTVPTFTAAGKDVIGMYSLGENVPGGGTYWNAVVLGKDVK